MSENAITRRGFLAGATGAAVAAVGLAGAGSLDRAYAAQDGSVREGTADGGAGQAVAASKAHSLCGACSSKCGFTGYVVDGRLTRLIADRNHPYAAGKLCACGYGYSQIAYSQDRLVEPLKRTDEGFEAITWDEAYAEIAEKVAQIIERDGPRALAAVHDSQPSGEYYVTRFMKALGSANVYAHDAVCDISKESGFAQAIGAGSYLSDVENSQMTMLIGCSYADAVRPSSVAALQRAHERGAHIVLVDSRCSNSIAFADEWVPIRPGTDLALILAMSHVLVKNGRYDAQYVEQNGVGFDEWCAVLDACTPEWAQGITGVDAGTIERLANEFAGAAPAASIEAGWRDGSGCSYCNSGETARAACLFNTLLGCWNQKGGALLTSDFSAGALDGGKFPEAPEPEGKQVGADEYPLALASMGVSLAAVQAAKEGSIHGMFFYGSNMVADCPDPSYVAEALDNLDLCVVIDVRMSETAQHASYVLPDTSYLERLEIPEFIGGKLPAVSLRDQVIEKVHPETRPVDQVFTELAQACGVGEYFDFTVEELADAQLKSVGLSLEGLRQAGGTAHFNDREFQYGTQPLWNTPTGKIQFASEACRAAGFSATPQWIEPKTVAGEGGFMLVGGRQAVCSGTQTADIPELMSITEKYDLTRVWMNAQSAAELGIQDGDEVEVSNGQHTGRVRCKVTERIRPGVLFVPSHYGCLSSEQETAYGVGLRQTDFVAFDIEPGYGGACTQEAAVSVKKVGA